MPVVDSEIDTIPHADRSVGLAHSIVLDQVDWLSPADYGHYLRLQEARRTTTRRVKLDALERVVREILTQTPVAAVPLPLSGPRKVWAEVVGREIRRRRDEAGFTQTQLAERTGIPQSHISRLENAEHSANRYTLEKIAVALGVTVSELDPTTTG